MDNNNLLVTAETLRASELKAFSQEIMSKIPFTLMTLKHVIQSLQNLHFHQFLF